MRNLTPETCSAFVDFDGVIAHQEQYLQWEFDENTLPCPGFELLNKWMSQGHKVFITTARTVEDLDKIVTWLAKHNIKYTDIILGCGRGPRYIINDKDPTRPNYAMAISCNLERNQGLGSSIES